MFAEEISRYEACWISLCHATPRNERGKLNKHQLRKMTQLRMLEENELRNDEINRKTCLACHLKDEV